MTLLDTLRRLLIGNGFLIQIEKQQDALEYLRNSFRPYDLGRLISETKLKHLIRLETDLKSVRAYLFEKPPNVFSGFLFSGACAPNAIL